MYSYIYIYIGANGIVIGGAGMGETDEQLIEAIKAVRAVIESSVIIMVQGINCPKLVSTDIFTCIHIFFLIIKTFNYRWQNA